MIEQDAEQPVVGFAAWYRDWCGVFANEIQAEAIYQAAIGAAAAGSEARETNAVSVRSSALVSLLARRREEAREHRHLAGERERDGMPNAAAWHIRRAEICEESIEWLERAGEKANDGDQARAGARVADR